MKLFIHVFNTWIISLLMGCLILLFYINLSVNSASSAEWFSLSFIPTFMFILVLALPSLFISMWFLSLIRKTAYSVYEQFFLWYLAAIAAITVNVIIPVLIFLGGISSINDFYIFWPAYTAVVLTITIRLKQFFSFTNKTTEYENDLV